MAYTYYNLTNLTSAGNETTVLTFVSEVNKLMNNVPGLLMLIAIYIVLMLILIRKGFDIYRTFAASSFAIMVLAIIAYPMEFISGHALILFVILCPFSIFALWVWGK